MSAMHLDHLMAQRRLPANAAQCGCGADRYSLRFAKLALTSPKPRRHVAHARRQDGFAIVTAIFLLLLLAALGALMVTMSSVQHTTSAQDVQGSRAYQAARTGIEWGVYQVMKPENDNYGLTSSFVAQYSSCTETPAVIKTFAPATTSVLGGTLAGYTVSVSCVRAKYDEGGNRVNVYQLTSLATTGTVGSTGYVERQISASVATCRKADDKENC